MRMVLVVVLLIAAMTMAGQSKQVTDHWEVKFTERFRLTSWDNTISLQEELNESRTFTRHRSHLTVISTHSPIFTFGIGLGNEFRYHLVPTTIEFDFEEVFVNQLYVRVSDPEFLPVSLTLGRQDLVFGEGFVVLDGTPLDGSRSIYFNALRLDWSISAERTLTAFACYTDTLDKRLPIIHEQYRKLVEQPESGLGLYYSGKHRGNRYDLYVIHKRQRQTRSRRDSEITTIGGRAELKLTDRYDLSLVVEGALQVGLYGTAQRRAYGGYQYLVYRPAWPQKPFVPKTLKIGAYHYSGDTEFSRRREDWDPMFARWPKWGDSYIYTLIRERGVAWWSNLWSVFGSVTLRLTESAELKCEYYDLRAPEEAGPELGEFEGPGTFRGSLVIGRLNYSFDRHWSGHLLWEGFDPGSFYPGLADSYAWIRAELMFTY